LGIPHNSVEEEDVVVVVVVEDVVEDDDEGMNGRIGCRFSCSFFLMVLVG